MQTSDQKTIESLRSQLAKAENERNAAQSRSEVLLAALGPFATYEDPAWPATADDFRVCGGDNVDGVHPAPVIMRSDFAKAKQVFDA